MKCFVITPFGPGHSELVKRSSASVEQAVAKGMGAFSEVKVIAFDDSQGQYGRSEARNRAVRQASGEGADWIFFLDADDIMAPSAFIAVANLLADHDAIWGEIFEFSPEKRELLRRKDQVSPITSIKEVLLNDPSLTLQMGHFVRCKVAERYPFDSQMNAGEDFDYYLRVWKAHRCIKMECPLFFNIRGQHSGGPRSANAADWRSGTTRVLSGFCQENEIVASVSRGDRKALFRVTNPLDIIQQNLVRGRFFEERELSETLLVTPAGARILDIGSNIGNHALFFMSCGGASMVHCYEPAPDTAALLLVNIGLNKIDQERYSIRRMGIGLQKENASLHVVDPGNIGANRIHADANGDLRVDSLDNLYPEEVFDLLKIDVEGMELEVLKGGERLIERSRPVILIEVANDNKAAFFSWLTGSGFRVHRAFELVNASNYLLMPRVLRKNFYPRGLAEHHAWRPRIPLAANQPAAGWPIDDFLRRYIGEAGAAELNRDAQGAWSLRELSDAGATLAAASLPELLKRFRGFSIVLSNSLGLLDDETFEQSFGALAVSGKGIVLMDIMDARWNHAYEGGKYYRDAEYYLGQANERGYVLKHYAKLPHKAAAAHDQLEGRVTLLHFAKAGRLG
jgi:FkbM family methyltransferase